MFLLGGAGCKKTSGLSSDAQDPANVNMAPVSGQTQVAQPQRVLADREAAGQYQQGEQNPINEGDYEADQAPPPLPQYTQPAATRRNTIWTPGYWQHSRGGYYWVPGAWVPAPYVGALWTPGYWGADGPRYRFHAGYWGRHVGFYGGVRYGGGYLGTGYRGGYWRGNDFYYNQAVNRVDPNMIREVYYQSEPEYAGVRVSFNGGLGGIALLPIAAELFAEREEHERPLRYQYDVEREASQRRGQFYGMNQGRPEVYIAPDGFERGEGRRENERPQAIIEQRGGGRGDEGRGHGDEGGGRGDQGRGHGNQERGQGDNGKGHGNGHGHD